MQLTSASLRVKLLIKQSTKIANLALLLRKEKKLRRQQA